MKRDCIHGQLARICELCERDTRITELEAELKRMRAVFNSALRWYRLYTTDLADDGKPTWDTDCALFINCARAERAKGRK